MTILHEGLYFKLHTNTFATLAVRIFVVLGEESPDSGKLDLGDTGTIAFYSPAVKSLGLLEGRKVVPSSIGGVGGMGTTSSSSGRISSMRRGRYYAA